MLVVLCLVWLKFLHRNDCFKDGFFGGFYEYLHVGYTMRNEGCHLAFCLFDPNVTS